MEVAEIRELSDQVLQLAGAQLMAAHSSAKDLAEEADSVVLIHARMIGIAAAVIYQRATAIAEYVKADPEHWEDERIERDAGDIATYAGYLTNFALHWYMHQTRFIDVAAYALLLQHLASQICDLADFEDAPF